MTFLENTPEPSFPDLGRGVEESVWGIEQVLPRILFTSRT